MTRGVTMEMAAAMAAAMAWALIACGGGAGSAADGDTRVPPSDAVADTGGEDTDAAGVDSATTGPDGGADVADAAVDVDGDATGSEGGWRSVAPIPKKTQENAVLRLGATMYVAGGFDDGGDELDDVWAYDLEGDSWEGATPLPHAVHHLNAAAVDGRLWVLGALSGGFGPDNVAWSWAPGEEVWSEATPMPHARRRGAGAVATDGATIYVVGGIRAGAVADVDAYDTDSGTWDALPALPDALDHLVAEIVEGTLYVIGGRGVLIDAHQATTWAYELDGGDAWVERAPMPTSRGGHAAGVVGGRIIVVGGEGNPASGSRGVFAAAEAYDPAADTWTALAPMGVPRHGTSAIAYGGALWVPGGADQMAFGAVDTVEVLDL